MFDVLIFGGGVSGMSCALVLGSARHKAYAAEKKIGIIAHQKASSLQEALFNNAYGIAPGTLGSELLVRSGDQLAAQYPHVTQITHERVLSAIRAGDHFTVSTNKNTYQAKIIVIAVGWFNTFDIDGLNDFVRPHKKSIPEKNRIELENKDHKVADGIYVSGTLAGWRSQLAIAAGSGAAVATDILTLWNGGIQSQSHDSIRPH
jgi:glycine/D-amino acid oxidase-like deaminating enzyme